MSRVKSNASDLNWEHWPDVVRMRNEGKTWRQIAAICNVKKECLRTNARRRGIDTRGAKQKNAEGINWADVWLRRKAGEAWPDIAAAYGVDETALRQQAAATGNKPTDRKSDVIRRICDSKWPGWKYAVEMREQGETWENIANYIGISVKVLREVMVMHGLREPPAPDKYESNYQGQLCWECIHANPNPAAGTGCSWSERFEPVEGWTAKPTVLYASNHGANHTDNSFAITKCPQYEKG